jgi:hypothetical protein
VLCCHLRSVGFLELSWPDSALFTEASPFAFLNRRAWGESAWSRPKQALLRSLKVMDVPSPMYGKTNTENFWLTLARACRHRHPLVLIAGRTRIPPSSIHDWSNLQLAAGASAMAEREHRTVAKGATIPGGAVKVASLVPHQTCHGIRPVR